MIFSLSLSLSLSLWYSIFDFYPIFERKRSEKRTGWLVVGLKKFDDRDWLHMRHRVIAVPTIIIVIRATIRKRGNNKRDGKMKKRQKRGDGDAVFYDGTKKITRWQTNRLEWVLPVTALWPPCSSERMTNDVTWTRAIACLAWCEGIFGPPREHTRRDCEASCPRCERGSSTGKLCLFLFVGFLINASLRCFLWRALANTITTRWSLED